MFEQPTSQHLTFLYSKYNNIKTPYSSGCDVGVFYFGGFLSEPRSLGDKDRLDLHADGLERVPAALPVHPHHAVVCAVLRHLLRVGAAYVVSAVGIG